MRQLDYRIMYGDGSNSAWMSWGSLLYLIHAKTRDPNWRRQQRRPLRVEAQPVASRTIGSVVRY